MDCVLAKAYAIHFEFKNGAGMSLGDSNSKDKKADGNSAPTDSNSNNANFLSSLFRAAGTGNREALNQIWPELYRSLHEIAAREMQRESNNSLLQTTAVVHEAYCRLAKQHSSAWNNQSEFLAAASVTMRRILVDESRKRNSKKRGGNTKRNDLSDTKLAVLDRRFEVLEIHDALRRLEEFSPQQSTALEMMIFGGATLPQISEALGMSVSTVERRIRSARAWLRRELSENLQPHAAKE